MISHFPCVGSQSTLNEVIENVAAVKLGKLKQTQCVLCVISERAKKLVPSRMDAKNFAPAVANPSTWEFDSDCSPLSYLSLWMELAY